MNKLKMISTAVLLAALLLVPTMASAQAEVSTKRLSGHGTFSFC